MSFMTLLDQRPIAANGKGTAPSVRIRPYESADGELIEAMSARLSKRSLYERFFAGTPTLPPRYLAALAKTDHDDREVVLAVYSDAVIGIAEYVRDKDAPARADLAVLVADDWQRRGIGRRLVTALGELADRRGIADFSADALMTNRSALSAISSIWPAARAERDGTTVRFTLPVRAVLPVPGGLGDLVAGAQEVFAGGDDAGGHRRLGGLSV